MSTTSLFHINTKILNNDIVINIDDKDTLIIDIINLPIDGSQYKQLIKPMFNKI